MSGIDIKSHKSFRKFFEDFYPAVYSFLLNYTGDEELARDLSQDTFLRIYEKRALTDTIEHAKAFLYTTARRLYLDHLKHARAGERYLDAYEDEHGDEHSFLVAVTREETLRILYSAIDRLPRQTRNVVMLGLHGKSNQEVAQQLGISINTVKSLKKSAYTSLRSFLAKDYWFILLFF